MQAKDLRCHGCRAPPCPQQQALLQPCLDKGRKGGFWCWHPSCSKGVWTRFPRKKPAQQQEQAHVAPPTSRSGPHQSTSVDFKEICKVEFERLRKQQEKKDLRKQKRAAGTAQASGWRSPKTTRPDGVVTFVDSHPSSDDDVSVSEHEELEAEMDLSGAETPGGSGFLTPLVGAGDRAAEPVDHAKTVQLAKDKLEDLVAIQKKHSGPPFLAAEVDQARSDLDQAEKAKRAAQPLHSTVFHFGGKLRKAENKVKQLRKRLQASSCRRQDLRREREEAEAKEKEEEEVEQTLQKELAEAEEASSRLAAQMQPTSTSGGAVDAPPRGGSAGPAVEDCIGSALAAMALPVTSENRAFLSQLQAHNLQQQQLLQQAQQRVQQEQGGAAVGTSPPEAAAVPVPPENEDLTQQYDPVTPEEKERLLAAELEKAAAHCKQVAEGLTLKEEDFAGTAAMSYVQLTALWQKLMAEYAALVTCAHGDALPLLEMRSRWRASVEEAMAARASEPDNKRNRLG